MKNIKSIWALLLLVVLAANGSYAGEIRTFSHQGEDYTVESRWINTKVDYYDQKYNGEFWGYSPFFFVKDDLIYFTKDLSATTPSTSLLVVDGQTGLYKEIAEINWGSVSHNTVAAVYAGIDSEGTCFVASYGTSTSSVYPFRIYPLEFTAGGIPSVTGCYELEMNKDCWIKSADVYGSLLSGNFSVASSTWNSLEIMSNQDLKTGISVWHYIQGQASGRKDYSQNITVPDIKFLSDNKIAVHDRHLLIFTHPGNNVVDYGKNAIAREPSLYSVEGDGFTAHSSINPSAGDDGFGNGMAIFTLGDDRHFMIYASSGSPVEFKLVSLPDYPESFENSEELLTIITSTDNLSSVYEWSLRQKTGVFVEKTDENTANVYLAGHGNGMASYTIKRDAPLNTGVGSIITDSSDAIEYYTVTGLRIPAKPASGFYIEKKGGKATKKYIR